MTCRTPVLQWGGKLIRMDNLTMFAYPIRMDPLTSTLRLAFVGQLGPPDRISTVPRLNGDS